MSEDLTILAKLMAVIEDRNARRPSGSYTTQLLDAGVEAIGAKVLEEAGELVEAARSGSAASRQPIIHEAADLVYHTLVLLAHCGVSLSELEAELARRFGVSGLEEKARRREDA